MQPLQVEAHFSAIPSAIARHLASARHSVRVMVQEFTDRDLFEALVACQRRGVCVALVLADCTANRHASNAWERLTALGATLYWLPQIPTDGDESVCLIDDFTVVSGDFQWTAVQDGDTRVSILVQHDGEIADYVRRSFLALVGDTPQTTGFEEVSSDAGQSQGAALSVYEDAQLEEMRLHIRMTEARVVAIETEIADIHRQIHLFDHQQDLAIGDLMRRYLDLKRRYLHAQYQHQQDDLQRQQAQAADDVYRDYEEARSAKASEVAPEQLDPVQQRELKHLYRKLAMQCHPDRVREEDKGHAQGYFQQLQTTFQNSDLAGLQKLRGSIETGLGVRVESAAIDPKQQLQQRLGELQQTLAQRNRQLAAVWQSKSWKELSSKPDWNAWFAQQAKRLKAAMQHYMTELNQFSQEMQA
ncbi:MAG: phospholipase D-like domain-containing protein [Burkholderiales bacterium]